MRGGTSKLRVGSFHSSLVPTLARPLRRLVVTKTLFLQFSPFLPLLTLHPVATIAVQLHTLS
jgi:hypothetical protein